MKSSSVRIPQPKLMCHLIPPLTAIPMKWLTPLTWLQLSFTVTICMNTLSAVNKFVVNHFNHHMSYHHHWLTKNKVLSVPWQRMKGRRDLLTVCFPKIICNIESSGTKHFCHCFSKFLNLIKAINENHAIYLHFLFLKCV